MKDGKRQLVIGGATRGYVALYRYMAAIDTVFCWLGGPSATLAYEQQGERRADYSKEMLKRLAERLTTEYGSGFSVTNLKFMRQFYLLNAQRIGQTASDLLPASEKRPLS